MNYNELPDVVRLAVDIARDHPLAEDYPDAIEALSRALAMRMPEGKSLNLAAVKKLYWTGVLAHRKLKSCSGT